MDSPLFEQPDPFVLGYLVLVVRLLVVFFVRLLVVFVVWGITEALWVVLWVVPSFLGCVGVAFGFMSAPGASKTVIAAE
jgi:hypothetical protein